MQGYFWAETPENELFVVMVVDGKGYIPGVGGAIDLSTVALLDPVPWPAQPATRPRNSAMPCSGLPAAVAMHECAILRFDVNG